MRKTALLVFVYSLFFAQLIFSQDNGAMLQIGVTGTGYYGDLNAGEGGVFNASYFSVSPGLEVGLQPAQWGRIAPQIRVGFGRFQSQDPEAANNPPEPIDTPDGVIIPNSFADVTLPYIVIGLEGRLFPVERSFTPLFSAGLRIQSFSSRNEEGVPLAQLWTTRLPEERTLPSLAPSFDLGFGFQKRINDRLRLNLIYHHIIVGSDYLDNLGMLGRQEGNDKLHSLRLSMSFDLGETRAYPVRKKKPAVEPEEIRRQEAVYDPALGRIHQPKVTKPKKPKKQKAKVAKAKDAQQEEIKAKEPKPKSAKVKKVKAKKNEKESAANNGAGPAKAKKAKEPKVKKEKKPKAEKAKEDKSEVKEKKLKVKKQEKKEKPPKAKKPKVKKEKKKKTKEKSQEPEEGL
jgi:hypothetical protein